MIELNKLEGIVRSAGEIVLSAQVEREDIEAKAGHQNFVTIYDQKVQDYLETTLQKLWPDYVFFGEENDRQKGNPDEDFAFIVDPIDGTSNFIHAIPFVAICVAVAEAGQIVQAVVYNPYLDEMYTAQLGEGAYLNGQKITTPDLALSDGLCGYGMSPYNSSLIEQTLQTMKIIMPHVTDLRRLGSAALDICAVAIGRQVAYFEYELQPWDFAAASLIATEAKCIVSNMKGEMPKLSHATSFLAAGPRARLEIEKLLEL